MESPIRVYVGSEEAQMLAVKVLEYSIRRRSSMEVEVLPLHHSRFEFPLPKDVRNRPRTPFSFQRFYIPALKGYQGRAIYLDSDMQVFQDIKALWACPFDGADLLAAREREDAGRRPQFSVMLLNCDELRWDITEIVGALDRGELTYETLMYEMAVARRISASIDPAWNSLERYVEGETALLHYTDMPTQPWLSRGNPLGYLWVRDLIGAVDGGFLTRQYVEEQVRQGFVRPSLLYQLDRRSEDARQLPQEGSDLDDGFVPPHKKMGPHGGGPRTGPLRFVRAVLGRLARARAREE
ncbi:MAG: glycosyl transferase [Gemmatimonadales bacterium]|nr:glycosyl transferase [Gemmatimonadales bacterium]